MNEKIRFEKKSIPKTKKRVRLLKDKKKQNKREKKRFVLKKNSVR